MLDFWLARQKLSLIALSHAERQDVIAGWSVARAKRQSHLRGCVPTKHASTLLHLSRCNPPLPAMVETLFEHERRTVDAFWQPTDRSDFNGLLRKERWYQDQNGQLVDQGSYEHYLQGTGIAVRGEPRSNDANRPWQGS
ncbi:hypothetical protein [Bradyrhizobium sp. ARR65]|uniref:hypothetical protein n=1 Tax=Bradyrhizobium sp. ARR65 TaxID=1040989 RepID=UPI0012F8B48E|nr:hypothetical protein [Bradyrhizobium sp. ARR65]